MPDINEIIKAIDDELERTGKNFLTPPEANKLLERLHILNDRDARSGLPLRKLLRQRKIPHAYQEGGKGSNWKIPHSNSKNLKSSNYPSKGDNNSKSKGITNNQDLDFTKIKKKIEEARENYKPDKIKYLLIAEAPPESLERFFYFLDVKTADWLFLGVMQTLYPSKKEEYLQQKRNSVLKDNLLSQFKDDGFYLIDLLDFPLSFYSGDLENTTDDLINKVKLLSDENTIIILIKANVYDTAFSILKSNEFNVIDKRIDFPASGGQQKFQTKFKEALEETKYFESCNS